MKLVENILIGLIRVYQKWFSIDHSFWGKHIPISVCIYQPTCSEYMIQAIQKYGVIKGVVKGFFRILRCHPFAKGGIDNV